MIFQFEIVEHLTKEVYGIVGDKCLTIAGLSRNIVSSVSATQILLRTEWPGEYISSKERE